MRGILPGNPRFLRAENGSLERLAARCAASLEVVFASADERDRGAAFTSAVRQVLSMLAVLASADRIPAGSSASQPVRDAALHLYAMAEGRSATYEAAVRTAREASGLDIFAAPDGTLLEAVRSLLCPSPDAPIERLFFETMPLSWIGRVYQHLLAYRPAEDGHGLELSAALRKKAGVYFTPHPLIVYITGSAIAPLIEPGPFLPRVLDPAMGGGDFLCDAVEFLSRSLGANRADIVRECVFGVDIDPIAVDIARFCAWACAGYPDGIADSLRSHLVCADALAQNENAFDWPAAFPEAFSDSEKPGFDAVVGNPPYVASKNHAEVIRRATGGQSDYYLLFLKAIVDRGLVRPGGTLAMVLPDPMLVRANAAGVRRKLIAEWTILSVLHISEAFRDANVANVVPVCRNSPPGEERFAVARIDRAADRRSFNLRPRETARALGRPMRREVALVQKRCEFLYLLEDGVFGAIVRRIHGEELRICDYQPPFAPLAKLNVRAIYRGEEVGKSAITGDDGELPVLLGGQSIQPYEILWEGRKAPRSWAQKPLERYQNTKILIQKSSAHVIAALDRVGRRHPGYVFPQSVYAVQLGDPGMHELYLLCILNSRVMNEYIRRTVTGYKLLQPQLEMEDIRALPIRRVEFTTPTGERETETARAIGIFEDESLRGAGASPFPELDNFAARCLTGSPEKSDVVHDLLVHLGRLLVDLTKLERKSPSAEGTRKLEAARAAVETVVWRLYSSQPAQMALPI